MDPITDPSAISEAMVSSLSLSLPTLFAGVPTLFQLAAPSFASSSSSEAEDEAESLSVDPPEALVLLSDVLLLPDSLDPLESAPEAPLATPASARASTNFLSSLLAAFPSGRPAREVDTVVQHVVEHLDSNTSPWCASQTVVAPGSAAQGHLIASGFTAEDLQVKRREPPTWDADETAEECPACSISFCLLRRRHHCRECGQLRCSRCVSSMPARHLGFGEAVLVCTECKARRPRQHVHHFLQQAEAMVERRRDVVAFKAATIATCLASPTLLKSEATTFLDAGLRMLTLQAGDPCRDARAALLFLEVGQWQRHEWLLQARWFCDQENYAAAALCIDCVHQHAGRADSSFFRQEVQELKLEALVSRMDARVPPSLTLAILFEERLNMVDAEQRMLDAVDFRAAGMPSAAWLLALCVPAEERTKLMWRRVGDTAHCEHRNLPAALMCWAMAELDASEWLGVVDEMVAASDIHAAALTLYVLQSSRLGGSELDVKSLSTTEAHRPCGSLLRLFAGERRSEVLASAAAAFDEEDQRSHTCLAVAAVLDGARPQDLMDVATWTTFAANLQLKGDDNGASRRARLMGAALGRTEDELVVEFCEMEKSRRVRLSSASSISTGSIHS